MGPAADEWQQVKKGRRQKNPTCSDPNTSSTEELFAQAASEPLDLVVSNKIVEKVQRLGPIIQDFVTETLTLTIIPNHVRCLGIGCCTTYPSQYQLAFAVALKELGYECTIYDPIMTPTAIHATDTLGIPQCIQSKDNNYTVTEPTLFYMPHCEVDLYQAVVKQNENNFDKIVIIGNSFKNYLLRPHPPTLPDTLEIPFPDFPEEDRAFNDLHFLHFPQHIWHRAPVQAAGNVGEIVSVDLKSRLRNGRAVIEREGEDRVFVRYHDDTTYDVRRSRLRGVVQGPALLLCENTTEYRRLAATHITKKDNVLEIGCSTGSTTKLLSLYANHVTATDCGELLIEDNKKMIECENVTWIWNDCFALKDWKQLVSRNFNAVFIDIGGNRPSEDVFALIQKVLADIHPPLVVVKSQNIWKLDVNGRYLDSISMERTVTKNRNKKVNAGSTRRQRKADEENNDTADE